MLRTIRAVWGCAFVTLVAAGIEFSGGLWLSGGTVLLVALGLAGLAVLLTRRYA